MSHHMLDTRGAESHELSRMRMRAMVQQSHGTTVLAGWRPTLPHSTRRPPRPKSRPCRRIGAMPFEWSPEQDAIIGAMSDKDASGTIGRSLTVCIMRRHKLGRPPFHARRVWSDEDIATCLTMSRRAAGELFGCTARAVSDAVCRWRRAADG